MYRSGQREDEPTEDGKKQKTKNNRELEEFLKRVM